MPCLLLTPKACCLESSPSDDVLVIIEDTEDIQLGVAVNPLESTYSLTLARRALSKRIGLCLEFILVNLISAAVIANYEQLSKYITLALFMPSYCQWRKQWSQSAT